MVQPLFDTARQINESLNNTTRTLGDNFTKTANGILGSLSSGLPPLPGLQNNGRGNSNGNGVLQSLVPTQAAQALSQVEDVIIPAGMPKPSSILLGQPRRGRTVKEEMVVTETPVTRQPASPGSVGVEGVNGSNGRRPGRAIGVQTT